MSNKKITDKYIGIVSDQGIEQLTLLDKACGFALDMRVRYNTQRNCRLWAGVLAKEDIEFALTLEPKAGIIFIDNASKGNQQEVLISCDEIDI